MKKIIINLAIAALGLAASAGQPKAPKSDIVKMDVPQSTFNWHAKKVTGEHKGTVKFQNGEVILQNNQLTGGLFNVNMTSIEDLDLSGEWHDKLVNHLKSDDFFSVVKYNTATLKINSAEVISGAKPGENNYSIKADLIVKGITQEITFLAFVIISKDRVVANASFLIDRTKYGIKYGSKSFFESIGDKAIDDNFEVTVRVVGTR
ncbi:MAG: YceI family protein [Bacteroidia bacterium]